MVRNWIGPTYLKVNESPGVVVRFTSPEFEQAGAFLTSLQEPWYTTAGSLLLTRDRVGVGAGGVEDFDVVVVVDSGSSGATGVVPL